jgi:sulfite reductase (NADPH) flavoprotein alpha-component
MTARVRIPNFLPETAPFTPEQRTWLNGLFAGLIALDDGVVPLSTDQAAALLPGVLDSPAAHPADDDEAPWHDPSIELPERMKLAEGKPLSRRMMAAMAQQDCGQCGYNCRDYADALFARNEPRLNLCVPGGKATARMLKSLYEEIERGTDTPAKAPPIASAAIVPADAVPASTKNIVPGRSRDCPVEVTFLSRRLLNKGGSEKETWHVEFDLSESGLDYVVGDSFGILPVNDPGLVDAVIRAIEAPPDFPIAGRTLQEVIADGVSLSPAPDMLFQLISYLTGGERRQKARALAAGQDPDGDAATLDVLAALHKFPGIRPDPEAFIESLDPLHPRVYSISSSPAADPGRISLTVDAVRYRIGERTRLGVGSTFLAERITAGAKLRAYVQKAHGFALPPNPAVPIIMVGPGTGVAPFRAFLRERVASGASGKNWLFFGHQRRDCDFFYEDELVKLRASGALNRLTLAWSRDGKEKVYVQHRMRDVGRDLWAWLEEGAHFYVCGDATRMAKDVELALVDVVAAHAGRSKDEAIAYVAGLKKSGRYQQDVY